MMTVRLKLALTVFATGVLTALLVVAAVLYGFERFERELTYRRASGFLMRVVAMYGDLLERHERAPAELRDWLAGLVLFEPDTQLYLLDARGTVLAHTGSAVLAPDFRVALAPVRQAVDAVGVPYVMGDDPEHMDANAVVAAQPVRRAAAGGGDPAGYLYLVHGTRDAPGGRWAAARASLGRPVLGLVVAVVALTTLLAAWIVVSVTRPLRQLADAMADVARQGLDGDPPTLAGAGAASARRDEFGQLAGVFGALLGRLREQWAALRRLDHFRREAVSNLSHDLRTPLTATVTCLETLDGRWAGDAARDADRALAGVALRNARNAARLVRAFAELARLDEPSFRLRTEVVDLRELLDDIRLRFAARAAERRVALHFAADAEPLPAAIDVELFERAIANLLDNALKFARAGDAITVGATRLGPGIEVHVADSGPGIAADELPHVFDRYYRSARDVAHGADSGSGLGLAIVKRIAELHGGEVAIESAPQRGTRVRWRLPSAPSERAVAQENP